MNGEAEGKTAAENRRRHRRFVLNQLIELDYGKECPLKAEGVNISRGGILCRTSRFCEPYQRVFALLILGQGMMVNSIRFEGTVVRCSGSEGRWETGIGITDISDRDRMILDSFIDTCVDS